MPLLWIVSIFWRSLQKEGMLGSAAESFWDCVLERPIVLVMPHSCEFSDFSFCFGNVALYPGWMGVYVGALYPGWVGVYIYIYFFLKFCCDCVVLSCCFVVVLLLPFSR